MRTRYINKIPLDKDQIPNKWMENLVSNGKFGGVMLVFIEGFTETEIAYKVKSIKEFCKTLKEGGQTMDLDKNVAMKAQAMRPMNGAEIFRPEYKELSDEQKAEVLAIKIKAGELFDLYMKHSGRGISLAITNLEQSVMWAVKDITA